LIHLVLIILLITNLLKHPDSFAVFMACPFLVVCGYSKLSLHFPYNQ